MELKGDQAKEYRFGLILKLSKEKKSQKAIAELTGCSQGWVSKVLKRYKGKSAEAIKVKGKPKGNESRLTRADFLALEERLLEGALHHGFETDNWSRERIAELIKTQFGTSYHVSHISKLMQKIGFSLQKPKTKSYRKDEQAVVKWKENELPAIKKSE
jgi:transposase